MRVVVEVTHTGNAMASLRSALGRNLLQEAGRELLRGVEDAFEQEGPGWAQLKPRTVAERRRKGFGPSHPIQHRTGEYKRSWKGVIDGDVLTISSSSFKAEILNKSGKNRPARRVVIGEAAVDRAVRAVDAALKRAD